MSRNQYKRSTGIEFEGEPRIILGDNGTTFEFHDGQPVMDRGMENGVLISLLTKPGWWGNAFLSDERQIGKTRFAEMLEGPITASKMQNAEKEGRRGLEWQIDKKMASDVEVQVSNRSGLGVDFLVKNKGPNGTVKTLGLQKYGSRYIEQATNPASARLTTES